MRALIDADYYLYRAAAAAEHEVEWTPDVWTYLCRITDAKDSFQAEMDRFQDTMPDHSVVLVLGDSTNFRYAIYPDYKANRRKYRRPAGYQALRDWAAGCWPSLTLAGVEGDDVLGVMAEEGDVIVSADKDLRSIPGLHLVDGGVIDVNRWEADFNFYSQALTGDATDGYPGCKGAGPVAARKALAGCKSEPEMWLAVLQAYIKAGHTVDFAVRMARCARILRPGEYDHAKQAPVLWCPPT
jgi:DNA polymerase-1